MREDQDQALRDQTNEITTKMPPQKRTETIVDMPQANEAAAASIRRSGSESDFSVMGDESPKQYRVRKSSLIGYVEMGRSATGIFYFPSSFLTQRFFFLQND
jgi:hypothetical protein